MSPWIAFIILIVVFAVGANFVIEKFVSDDDK